MVASLLALGVMATASCGSDSSGSEATPAPSGSAATVSVAAAPTPTGTEQTTLADTGAATTAPAASDTSTTTPGSVAAGADSDDPCRLLTADEAAAALGREVAPPRILEFGPGLVVCDYYSATEEAGPASVHAAVLSKDIPKDMWEQAQLADGFEAVPGVGELAFFDGDTTLEVYANGTWVSVQMINSTQTSDLLAIFIQIGRNAVDRL